MTPQESPESQVQQQPLDGGGAAEKSAALNSKQNRLRPFAHAQHDKVR